jgi:hypothetical protein
MTRAALSQAERCLYRGRIRRFDADEIVAFARAFELPISFFFSPPEPHLRGKPVLVNGKPGKPRAHVTSPSLSRNEMMLLAARALMPANANTSAAELNEIMTTAWERTLRGYLEQHPEAFATIASGLIPPQVAESMTPAQEEKYAKELAEAKSARRKRQ